MGGEQFWEKEELTSGDSGMGNPGAESGPSVWKERGCGWMNSARAKSQGLRFGRRSELGSSGLQSARIIKLMPQFTITRSLLLPDSGGQRSLAPQSPTPFRDQSVPLQITGALPSARQTGKFCKSVKAGAHIRVWEHRGGSGLSSP